MTKRQQGKGKKERIRNPKPGSIYRRRIKKIDKVVTSGSKDPQDLIPDPNVYKKPV